jgi:gluconate 5-dehydrogenase
VLIKTLGEEALIGNSPLQRLGDDEDLKGATLLFASDAGKHITGQVLAVDGGYSAV